MQVCTLQQNPWKLPKIFENADQFCDEEIKKFGLMLWRGIYPYEYMDGWGRFNKTPLPTKKQSYSNLTMESIQKTNANILKESGKTFNYNI